MMPRALTIFLLLIVFSFPAIATDQVPVTIQTRAGAVKLKLEIATTEEQQEKGLMLRTHIPDREGMLFAFAAPQQVIMWMKDTLVPLDMIFIDAHGTITRLAEKTTPQSLAQIPSQGPVLAVIEVAGGTAERYHIAKGDTVLYSLFHDN